MITRFVLIGCSCDRPIDDSLLVGTGTYNSSATRRKLAIYYTLRKRVDRAASIVVIFGTRLGCDLGAGGRDICGRNGVIGKSTSAACNLLRERRTGYAILL